MRLQLPLYLRIWLAVIAAVAVITVVFGWLWQVNSEQRPVREIVIRNLDGDVLGQMRSRPVFVPGEGLEFPVTMQDGSTLVVQMPPRPRRPGEGPAPRPWARGSIGLMWMLAIAALAVAVGSYPIIRRLTRRLDALRVGVERWGEGDLSTRVDESGSDEAAFLARRFNHAAARVEQLVNSHKSLLANASHELRSPLARIRMGLELMGNAPGTASAQAEILRNIAELDQLVEEILLASRLDSPNADVGAIEPVDLTGLVAEECAQTGAELEISSDGHAVVVEGAPRLLRRVVRNLLENARRHSRGPVTVEVTTQAAPAAGAVAGDGSAAIGASSAQGGFAVLTVCDRGPGVPPDQRERIFEPFYRLPGASERSGGVGLGLSLVKSIVQRHGGSVQCDDRPGGGARFTVRLPRRAG